MLGLLLGLGTKLVGEAAYAISDAKYMSSPSGHFDDGTPYYLNRKGQRFAANGERVVKKLATDVKGNLYTREVGERTGKIYIDRERTFEARVQEQNERHKQMSLKNGLLAYEYRDRSFICFGEIRNRTREISTGKFIAALTYNPDKKEFKKYYLAPNAQSPWETIEGDPGIVITKSEFLRLNVMVSNGGHLTVGKKEFDRDFRLGLI